MALTWVTIYIVTTYLMYFKPAQTESFVVVIMLKGKCVGEKIHIFAQTDFHTFHSKCYYMDDHCLSIKQTHKIPLVIYINDKRA